MATDFKSLKKPFLSVPMDVRSVLSLLEREVFDRDGVQVKKQAISDRRIEGQIAMADSIVHTYLDPIYGASSLSGEKPHFKGPVANPGNNNDLELLGVIVAATAITEQWIITFTDNDTFEVIGSVSGRQGSGDLTHDFTTTNGDLQIKKDDWDNPAPSDKIEKGTVLVLSTSIVKPIVSTLSAILAASFVADSIYSETESKGSPIGKTLRERFQKLIDDITKDDSVAGLDESAGALPEAGTWGWNIDKYGHDMTRYDIISGDSW